MARFSIILITVLFSITFLGVNLSYAEGLGNREGTLIETNNKEVQLTDKQKTELTEIHKEIFEKRKALIGKYVEFGIIDEEKGKIIISKLERRYEYAEKNGFIPNKNRDCRKKRNW